MNYSTLGSRNMEFYNELLQGRLGLLKFDAAALSGPVQLIDQFWKYTSTWYLMTCTTKDIYTYDFDNARWDIRTPIYATGTIYIDTSGSATAVIGSGSSWDSELNDGDFIKIGTGSYHTGSTWYEIKTVTDDNNLILKSDGPHVSNSQYAARQCFQGTSTDAWRTVTFLDENLGETWIATNGVDTPIRFTGSNQVQALSGLPTNFVSAKFVEIYKDRIIFLWTIEVGNQPQRERWSAVADCETWSDSDFKDFIEDGYWITGTIVWSNYHIVFRERDAMLGRWVGGTAVFDYDKADGCAGVWAPDSIVSTELTIYYYGPDNKFHSWNVLSDKIISEAIMPYAINFSPTLEPHIYGFNIEGRNQIRWAVPYGDASYMNAMVVYDYAEEIIKIWEYQKAQTHCCIGEYINTADLYLDDSIWGEYYLDEQEGYWDDRTFLSAAPITVYGGDDGYVRKADIGITDDGETYNRVFESTRMNWNMPNQIKRLWKQQHWLESELSGNVTISLMKDDNVNFEAITKTISLINAARDIIKENITWNKHAQNFKTRIEATNHFAMLGFLNYIFPKGKTHR